MNLAEPGPEMTPNVTCIPNIILDVLMPQLSGSEEKIIRVICRQTYGWHKKSDRISNSQMIAKSGIEEATLKRAVKSLADRGIIIRHIGTGRTMTEYSINYDPSGWRGIILTPPQKEPPEGIKLVSPEGTKSIHNKRNYQKKLSKEPATLSILPELKSTKTNQIKKKEPIPLPPMVEQVMVAIKQFSKQNLLKSKSAKAHIEELLEDYNTEDVIGAYQAFSRDSYWIENDLPLAGFKKQFDKYLLKYQAQKRSSESGWNSPQTANDFNPAALEKLEKVLAQYES